MPHIHQTPGHVDHTVEVLVVYNGKVLLRKHDKYDLWLGVGGHVELDEDPNQTAIREVKEEVGLAVTLVPPKGFVDFEEDGYKELLPPVFVNRHRINAEHEHVGYTYFATCQDDTITPENQTDEWQWLTKDEIEANDQLRPHIKQYALTALATVGQQNVH